MIKISSVEKYSTSIKGIKSINRHCRKDPPDIFNSQQKIIEHNGAKTQSNYIHLGKGTAIIGKNYI